MAFCAKCGAQLAEGSGFCSACGTAMAAQGGAPATGAAPAPAPAGTATSGMTDNVAGALCYIVIIGIIFLLTDPYKNNRFVRFHAFQAIFFAIAWWVFWIVWSRVVFGMLFSGTFGLLWSLGGLIELAWGLTWIFLVYKAYNNEQFKLPIIGDIAAKQAGV